MSGNNVFDGLFASPDRREYAYRQAGNDAPGYHGKGDITDAEYRAAPGIDPGSRFLHTRRIHRLALLIKGRNFSFHNILISLAGFPA
ncbi:hypothetical protein [Escherichia coli]|uniref:hypothetical protein n=1 Tax=Escherichia coli TaxID=562 RepID=UPI0020271253|nr:hypothetical protein [Escherichia coli]